MRAFANAATLTAECERSRPFNFAELILNSVSFLWRHSQYNTVSSHPMHVTV